MNTKEIDAKILKLQKKMEKLQEEKEKLEVRLLDSCGVNCVPESLKTIIGNLCIRYNIPWLLVFNSTMNAFEVIGYDTHENQFVFDIEGRIRELSFKGDYHFVLTDEEQEITFPNYFAVKFAPEDAGSYKQSGETINLERDSYKMSSVKIDLNTGKIVGG